MQNREPTTSQILEELESDGFYVALRSREISETDSAYIKEFVSKTLTDEEWYAFLMHCLENQIDPYKEMREIIYSTYAKVLKNSQ